MKVLQLQSRLHILLNGIWRQKVQSKIKKIWLFYKELTSGIINPEETTSQSHKQTGMGKAMSEKVWFEEKADAVSERINLRAFEEATCAEETDHAGGIATHHDAGVDVSVNVTEPASKGSPSFQVPDLDQYQLCEKLGEGGMGVVYRAIHKATGREFAIKFLHKEHSRDHINIKRFQQEAHSASLLTHSNLVSCYDSGIAADGAPYLVMDLLSGPTLDEVLSKEGFIDMDAFFNIFIQICEALEHAHLKGVLHRDVKPSNIMLQPAENAPDLVKIVDFGIARVLQPTARTFTKLTQSADVIGSPAYMSPEQCLGYTIDERSDIYSLGVVMYECLAGRPPYSADNAIQTIVRHLQEKPRPINRVRSDAAVPDPLEEIIAKCLEKNPEDRFQSAADLRRALEALRDNPKLQKGVFVSVRRHWRNIKNNKFSAIFVVAIGLGMVLISGIMGLYRSGEKTYHQQLLPFGGPLVSVETTAKELLPPSEPPNELKSVRDYALMMSRNPHDFNFVLRHPRDFDFILQLSQQGLSKLPSLRPIDRAFFERKMAGAYTTKAALFNFDLQPEMLTPERIAAQKNLFSLAQQHYSNVYKVYEQANASAIMKFSLLKEMAHMESMMGNDAKALELYRKALVLAKLAQKPSDQPEDQIEIMDKIGMELQRLDKQNEAIEQFKAAIDLERKVSGKYMAEYIEGLYIELYDALKGNRRYKEALAVIDEYANRLRNQPKGTIAQYKADVLMEMGRKKEAAELIKSAEDPDDEGWRMW